MKSNQLIVAQRNSCPPSARRLSVSLTYGIHYLECEVAGLTVAEAGVAFGDVLNLDPVARPYLSGRHVSDDLILQPGDRLEWVRGWGRKGSGDELRRIAAALEEIAGYQKRIAEHFDPQKRATVGTKYIAERLGVTIKWAGDLVRSGEIPKTCICPKSGEGKYWRFWKEEIDKWIEER